MGWPDFWKENFEYFSVEKKKNYIFQYQWVIYICIYKDRIDVKGIILGYFSIT